MKDPKDKKETLGSVGEFGFIDKVRTAMKAFGGGVITAKLNKVHGQTDSGLDPMLEKLQSKAISPNRW